MVQHALELTEVAKQRPIQLTIWSHRGTVQVVEREEGRARYQNQHSVHVSPCVDPHFVVGLFEESPRLRPAALRHQFGYATMGGRTPRGSSPLPIATT
jgi:hypothetical protein